MKAAFLLDEQVSPRVAEQLTKRGIDTRAVCGSTLAGKDDAAIFRAAVSEGRIMVTYNIPHFSAVFADLIKEGAQVPGLVFVDEDSIPNSDLQGLVRALSTLAGKIEKGDVDASGGVFLT